MRCYILQYAEAVEPVEVSYRQKGYSGVLNRLEYLPPIPTTNEKTGVVDLPPSKGYRPSRLLNRQEYLPPVRMVNEKADVVGQQEPVVEEIAPSEIAAESAVEINDPGVLVEEEIRSYIWIESKSY